MKWIWKALKLLLVTVLFVTAVRCFELVREFRCTAVITLDGTVPGAAEAEEICEDEAGEEVLAVCFFWEETANVFCEENGRSAVVTLVVTEGNPALLVFGGSELYWREDGCLIDQDTAYSIFGSGQASGQTLWIGGKSYTVCGTFASELPTVIRSVSDSDESALTQVAVRASSTSNLQGKAEQFLTRHGLSGTVISTVYLTAFAGDLLLLVPLLLIWRLAGHAAGKRTALIQISSLFFLAFCTIGLAFRYFEIPSDMIPTKWSDFSFWGTWWEEQKNHILLLLTMSLSSAQTHILWNCFVSLCSSIAAAFLAVLS
ncbi:MAG: ABC transporter permease [Lachnospiraceae bacterium]|nr:ABC transporter permease [Lachnospiraceae bacterium]